MVANTLPRSKAKQLRLLACAVFCIVLVSGCEDERRKALTLQKPKTLQFDHRQWQRIQQNDPRTGADYTLEYLPPGDTKTTWKELLTEQFFNTVQVTGGENGASRPQKTQQPTPSDFASIYVQKLRRNNNLQIVRTVPADTSTIVYWNGLVRDIVPKEMSTIAQPRRLSPHQDDRGVWHFSRSSNDLAGSLKEWIWNRRNQTPASSGGLPPNPELCLVRITKTAAGIHLWQYAHRVPAAGPPSKSGSISNLGAAEQAALLENLKSLP